MTAHHSAPTLKSVLHGAVGVWLRERISALILLILTPWFALWVAQLPLNTHESFVAWVINPWHYIPLLAFVFVSCYHTLLGLESIILDYVQTPRTRLYVLGFVKFFLLAVLIAVCAAVFWLSRET